MDATHANWRRRRRRPPRAPASGGGGVVVVVGAKQERPSTQSPAKRAAQLTCDRAQRGVIELSDVCRPMVVATAAAAALLLLLLLLLIGAPLKQAAAAVAPPETQLVAEVGAQAQLPCLIGKALFCGEPYFIAWYKFNTSARAWTRLDYRPMQAAGDNYELGARANPIKVAPAPNDVDAFAPVERIRFKWKQRTMQSHLKQVSRGNNNQFEATSSSSSSSSSANECLEFGAANNATGSPGQAAAPPLAFGTLRSGNVASLDEIRLLFDCATLSISPVDFADEGQYKCEITFSEVLDFEKCPTSTQTRLTLTARPGAPQVFVNGANVQQSNAVGAIQQSSGASLRTRNQQQQQQLKEGSQVRLECRSSGGKPAPRIDWLNVTTTTTTTDQSSADNDKDSYAIGDILRAAGATSSSSSSSSSDGRAPDQWIHAHDNHHNRAAHSYMIQPMRSTSATSATTSPSKLVTTCATSFTLSRAELNSRFVCLVQPTATTTTTTTSVNHNRNGINNNNLVGGGALLSLEGVLRDPKRLVELIDSVPMNTAAAAAPADAFGMQRQNNSPMVAWTKLDVAVKPVSVSVLVQDVASNSVLIPITQRAPAAAAATATATGSGEPPQPYYALKANRLYAIQCVVEQSRPRSQVVWFNRTAPLPVEQVELDARAPIEFELPATKGEQADEDTPPAAAAAADRLSSFVKHTPLADGSYRTVASVLWRTTFRDHFDELYCRVTNSAFEIDELVRVAPIMLARLSVNFAPSAWLECDSHKAKPRLVATSARARPLQMVKVDRQNAHRAVKLSCNLAANPFTRNAIVQFEWLKDGRKINTSNGAHYLVERANHLHLARATTQQRRRNESMESGAIGVNANGAATDTLLVSSSLTIRAPVMSIDSAQYSCAWRLIPHATQAAAGLSPPPQQHSGTQLQFQSASASDAASQSGQSSGNSLDTIQLVVSEGPPATIAIVPAGLLAAAAVPSSNTDGGQVNPKSNNNNNNDADDDDNINSSSSSSNNNNNNNSDADDDKDPSAAATSALDLNEAQLGELMDFVDGPASSRKSSAELRCLSPDGIAMSDTKYEWVFTDLNGTDHSIGEADGLVAKEDYQLGNNEQIATRLDLKQFLESKLMRQRRHRSTRTGNFDVAAAVVGNFSCRANNSHGSMSVSLPLKVTGRPLCKLEIGPKYISNKNELIIELLCNVYSSPALLETIWFRNGHQAHVNKSSLASEVTSSALINTIRWHIMAVDERQDFKLEEVFAQPNANFKCVARNSFGFSEPCELNQADKRTLAAIAATMTVPSSVSVAPGANLANRISENEIDHIANNNLAHRWTESQMFGSHPLLASDRNASLGMHLFASNNQNLIASLLPTSATQNNRSSGSASGNNNDAMQSTAQLQATTSNWSAQLHHWLLGVSKLDLLLIGAGSLALVWVLLVLIGGRLLGRRYPLGARSHPSRQVGAVGAATTGWQSKLGCRRSNRSSTLKSSSWRSNNTSSSDADFVLGRGGADSGAMLFQNGYATNKHPYGVPTAATNYYANSNPATTAATTTTTTNGYDSQAGDSSEIDMIQSAGSQSSHYDCDFVQQQQQQQQQLLLQQQQPIYFNGGSNNGRNPNSMATLATSSHRTRQQQTMSPPTMLKSSQTSARSSRLEQQPNNAIQSVPLIDGTQNSSRIRLDYAQTSDASPLSLMSRRPTQAHYGAANGNSHQYHQRSATFRRGNPNNATVNSSSSSNNNNNPMRHPNESLQQTNEHIYDDIVYNRMVL